ncbi:MAG: small multi-drug export protein [Halorhodospira sp.]
MEILIKLGVVLALAATPWVELMVVIPMGAAMGLPVPLLTLVAFVGNALPVFAIIALYQRWQRRRGSSQRRWSDRAMAVWHRYGLPGLALLAPVITGIHLATAMALALGTPRQRVAWWMTASLALWAVVTAVVTAAGVEWLAAGPAVLPQGLLARYAGGESV